MRFAYADPPYFMQGVKHYGDRHADAHVYDSVAGHKALIDRLCVEYQDGWAMSASSPSLHVVLPLCPGECRVMAWVKPFAAFKANVGVAYAWEPVIVYRGRRRSREQDTVRDWVSVNITLQRGFPGAKPEKFAHWIMDVLNVQDGDTIDDLFPGSGACSAVFRTRLEAHQPKELTLS